MELCFIRFVLFWNYIVFIVFDNIVNCSNKYLFLCVTGVACVRFWNYYFILWIFEGKQFIILYLIKSFVNYYSLIKIGLFRKMSANFVNFRSKLTLTPFMYNGAYKRLLLIISGMQCNVNVAKTGM